MFDVVGVMWMWRRYEIVSARGTNGTYLQRLLVFTTARKKAPDGVIDALLRRYLGARRPSKRAVVLMATRRSPSG